MNHHSRYDVSQRKRCDVPQEVPHGDNLLYGRRTPRRTHYTARLLMTRPRLWALLNCQEWGIRFTVFPATIATLS